MKIPLFVKFFGDHQASKLVKLNPIKLTLSNSGFEIRKLMTKTEMLERNSDFRLACQSVRLGFPCNATSLGDPGDLAFCAFVPLGDPPT